MLCNFYVQGRYNEIRINPDTGVRNKIYRISVSGLLINRRMQTLELRSQLLLHQLLVGLPTAVSKQLRANGDVNDLEKTIERTRAAVAVLGRRTWQQCQQHSVRYFTRTQVQDRSNKGALSGTCFYN